MGVIFLIKSYKIRWIKSLKRKNRIDVEYLKEISHGFKEKELNVLLAINMLTNTYENNHDKFL